MADTEHRPEEQEPLLAPESERATFSSFIGKASQEPFSFASKILLAVILVLLLLSSTFIGLFAGLQHRLSSSRKPDQGDDLPSVTITETYTITSTQTSTIVPKPTSSPKTPENICLTSDCVVLASSIITALDPSIDPCEDFYQFSNGGWLREHPIPADKGIYGRFNALAVENQRIAQSLLDVSSEVTESAGPDDVTRAKLANLYASCTNETQLNDLGSEGLLKLTRKVRNLWSATPEAPEEDTLRHAQLREKFTDAVADLHSIDISAFFDIGIEGDEGDDPNFLVPIFSQPSLGLLAKEYYQEEEVVEVYTSVIEKALFVLDETENNSTSHTLRTSSPLVNAQEADQRMPWDKRASSPSKSQNVWPPWPFPTWGDPQPPKRENKTTRVKRLAKEVVHFERRIAQAGADLDVLYQDPIATYNPYPTENLTALLPVLDFPVYLSSFAVRSFPHKVIVTYPPYLTALSQILSNTTADVIESYMVLRIFFTYAENLGSETELWQINRKLFETLNGIKPGAVGDRGEWCVSRVENALGFALGRFFVQETFIGDSKTKGTKVITDIISAFKDSLRKLPWMDKSSADAAAEKASAIRVKVGYPLSPNTTNAESIERYYASVKIDRSDFFGNMLSAAVDNEKKAWATLGKRRDLEAWEMNPSTVNAYFNPPANEIVFPAGIMRPPFYHRTWPSYMAYGAFGAVAAHELTHAFDSSGRMYNPQGKLEQWWSNATSEGFEERKTCISKQYSAYTIDDGKGGQIHVNGNLTSGENIGDSGLVQAFRAWKSQYSQSLKQGEEYILPGLNYTREQLFFIAFGQVWGQSIKPQAAVQRIRTDPHSPNQFRVDGTLSNIKEFAEAFKCRPGSKLNPPVKERCELW
ncbi:zincin [Sistotremastrum suecicum HHB10207 ss-3]|uniref:Zincin n=1 Tax=Sistotremastrum suecicum HHB10207 ss-3 TaxID=1314776 RepID=A0A166IUD7_9AGAM|nr:zincin [Sistotremastrum suecicum HHB10207 ss-3]